MLHSLRFCCQDTAPYGNFVEVVDLAAKYCSPTMKGDFLYFTKYMAQDLEYFSKGNSNVLPKTYQGNNFCPIDSFFKLIVMCSDRTSLSQYSQCG